MAPVHSNIDVHRCFEMWCELWGYAKKACDVEQNIVVGKLKFNPYSALLVTSYCAEKIVSVHLRVGSASAERVGQEEVGGVTRRVTCTWWLLGLAMKEPLLGPGRPPLTLIAWTGLQNTTLTM